VAIIGRTKGKLRCARDLRRAMPPVRLGRCDWCWRCSSGLGQASSPGAEACENRLGQRWLRSLLQAGDGTTRKHAGNVSAAIRPIGKKPALPHTGHSYHSASADD